MKLYLSEVLVSTTDPKILFPIYLYYLGGVL